MPIAGHDLVLRRPRDSEDLLVDAAGEHEELLPYWAELWPAGVALAEAAGVRAWRGARVLELGCGLGLASIAAALGGARVLATDWSAASVAATARNAEANGAQLETAVADWNAPEVLLAGAPWDAVLAADVLYEARNVPVLLDLLPRLTRQVLLADPGRATSDLFFEAASGDWNVTHLGMVRRMNL